MKNAEVYIAHVLECIDAILVDYYGGLKNPKELFLRDDKTKQATLHRLQTLGQAVKNIKPEVREAISAQVDWRKIGEMCWCMITWALIWTSSGMWWKKNCLCFSGR